MPTKPNPKACVKCGKSTNYSFACNQIQVKMCPTCSDKYLEIRDKLVEKAFKDFIK